jgi:DNA repair protein RadC
VAKTNNSTVQAKEVTYLRIQDWAQEDRPREKLIQKGAGVLSEAELIGILLGSGTRNLSAVGLAQSILQQHNNDLNELAKRSVKELQKYKGVGVAKAVTIVSAMELSRRRKTQHKLQKPTVEKAADVYELMRIELLDKQTEEFWIVLLSRSSRVIAKHLISSGGTAQLAVDPKVVFKIALDHHAASIILVHNHPSNNPKPSHLDIELTERLMRGGKLLDIPILDHVIFAEDTYFSFADEHMVL